MKEQMREHIENTKGLLQDLVVVVSLVRTLTDSFGSASDLYRKLKRKSKNIKEDIKEDLKEHIREDIKEEIEEHHKDHGPRRRRGSDSDHDYGRHRPVRWRSQSRHRRKDESSDSDEESIMTSSTRVRAEFDRGFHTLGEKYATGDLITRNQLQSQIIALQQTLLYIYEDILLNGDVPRHAPAFHVAQLIQTTRTAREASIGALSMQYQRMLSAPESHRALPPPPPGALPLSPVANDPQDIALPRRPRSNTGRTIVTLPDTPSPTVRPTTPKLPISARSSWGSDSSSNAGRAPKSKPNSRNLYCVYARDLQHKHSLPLSDNFKAGGDNRCPYCHFHIPARPGKAWEIVKENEKRTGVDRTFLIGTRFVVKCHRDGGGYACALCSEHREADTVCTEVRALVEHLWKEHSCAELEWDENIGEER